MSKVILWDFDGTLAHRGGGWSGTFLSVIKRSVPDVELSPESIRPFFRTGFPWHRSDMEHHFGANADAWWDALTPVFHGALEGLNVPDISPERVVQLVRAEYLKPAAWKVSEGAAVTLDRLRSDGWMHVIVSNHVPELPYLVEALGLSSFFQSIFTSARIGVEKPHPKFLREVMNGIGGTREVWLVGDSVNADIAAARNANIPSILVGSTHADADHCINTLDEVANIIVSPETGTR